jgi:hypothetical protein
MEGSIAASTSARFGIEAKSQRERGATSGGSGNDPPRTLDGASTDEQTQISASRRSGEAVGTYGPTADVRAHVPSERVVFVMTTFIKREGTNGERP